MRNIILIIFVLTFCSCAFPVPTMVTKVTSPYTKGIVVECDTGSSIQNAKVSFEGRESFYVLTDSGGNFTIEQQKDLVLLNVHTPCPVYQFPKPRQYPSFLVVTCKGYEDLRIPLIPTYENHRHKIIEHAKKGEHYKQEVQVILNNICLEKKVNQSTKLTSHTTRVRPD